MERYRSGWEMVEERVLAFSEAREALARFAYDEVSRARKLFLSSFQRVVEAKIIEEPLIAFVITWWLTQRCRQYR